MASIRGQKPIAACAEAFAAPNVLINAKVLNSGNVLLGQSDCEIWFCPCIPGE